MDDFEKAQFWEGLNRLYVTSVALREATQDLLATARTHENLLSAHDNRLDRAEIYIQGIIDDARRDRLTYARMGETARQAHDEVAAIEKRLEGLYEELKRLRERRESGNGGASEQKG